MPELSPDAKGVTPADEEAAATPAPAETPAPAPAPQVAEQADDDDDDDSVFDDMIESVEEVVHWLFRPVFGGRK